MPKKIFHKAPKLIYTVILWYRFVVQPPPPPRLGGGGVTPLVGRLQGGGGVHCTNRAECFWWRSVRQNQLRNMQRAKAM